MRMFHLEPVKPIYAKARAFITFVGVPDRNIRLLHQIFQRAIAAVIVDNEEVIKTAFDIILNNNATTNKNYIIDVKLIERESVRQL